MSTEQTLSPHEAACLLAFSSADETLALPELAWRSELQVAQARSAIERLKLRNAVEQTTEQIETSVTLNDFGQQCQTQGIPELRLLTAVTDHGTLPVQAIQSRDDLERSEAGAAFGALRRNGVLVIDNNTVTLAPNPASRRRMLRLMP